MTTPGSPTPAQLSTFETASESQRALFEVAIVPHGAAIARWGMRGDVAVVVHAPDEEMRELAIFLGWDQQAPVFRMSNAKRKVFADNIEKAGDTNTARWLRREDQRGNFRTLATAGPATLALNFRRGRGWAVEPT
jgi:hypothetical protein